MTNNPINHDLMEKVFELRDTFGTILDQHGTEIDSALRIKMAKAELVLNRVGILIKQELAD